MSAADHPRHVTAEDWDHCYQGGDLPWDTKRPSRELVHALTYGFVQPGRALELGCGTGTNAIYLAEKGFQVTAVDISAVAINRAQQRAQAAQVRVDFYTADVADAPGSAPYDFVFDRGCYHCVRRTNLAGYLWTLDRLTRPGSRFLLLAGNANEQNEGGGPPRVSDAEIHAELGRLFAADWMRPFRFEDPDGREGPLGWSVGMVRRDA